MKVALTGATGFIGSHVLTDLQEHGHEVTALVRDGARADLVAARGATPAVIDLYDRPAVTSLLADADGAIHTASPGDTGIRAVVIVSGTAYGGGGGAIPGALLASSRDDAGNLIMIGSGHQHWSTVHVADLADAFRRVLEADSARGRYVIGNGANSTVAELTEAAAVAIGAPGAVPGSEEEARARFGKSFAEVLLLDQGTGAARARAELGWYPSHPSLVDEFRHGSYRK